MKVTDVSLYRNGIGVFRGKTNGKFLTVQVKQMNDVLKTIKVIGKSQAKTNLTFPSPKSVNGDISIDFDNPLLSILKSLNGKKIEILHEDKKSSIEKEKEKEKGIVMGIKEEVAFVKCCNNETKIKNKRYKLILMIREEDEYDDFEEEEEEGGGEENGGDWDLEEGEKRTTGYNLKQFYLDDIDSINLLDGSKKIEDYIDVQNMKSSESEIKLKIIGGEPPYDVVYANSVAVWKVIYEINIKEAGKAQLTLYSVVDNNSSSDWNDVNLNLVSEIPYSVHADLFSIINLEKKENGRSRTKGLERFSLKKRAPSSIQYEVMAESEPVQIEEAKVKNIGIIEGSFKQFSTKASIDVNESSKVLLKKYPIKVEDWLYYEIDFGDNPDMAIAVISKDGFSMKGPLTIYNNHTYLGESLVDHIKATTRKEEVNRNIFTYAKDLQCDVSRSGSGPVLLTAQVTEFSKLIIRIRFYYKQVTVYDVKYARKEPIKLRLVSRLPKNFIPEELLNVLEKITGKKQKLDECGGVSEIEKKEKKVTATITKVKLRMDNFDRKCEIDFDMNESFKMIRHQYYFEVKTYNLLDKMHIISLLDMNLVLNDIDANKENLIKHANLVEEKEKFERRYEELDNALLTSTVTKGINKMYEEKERIENKIKELNSEIKNLRDNIINKLEFDKSFVKIKK